MVNLLGNKLKQHYKYEPVEPDILVDEKYDLQSFISNTYVIHTTGHSPGYISIIIDNKMAIVGYTMHDVFPSSTYPPLHNIRK